MDFDYDDALRAYVTDGRPLGDGQFEPSLALTDIHGVTLGQLMAAIGKQAQHRAARGESTGLLMTVHDDARTERSLDEVLYVRAPSDVDLVVVEFGCETTHSLAESEYTQIYREVYREAPSSLKAVGLEERWSTGDLWSATVEFDDMERWTVAQAFQQMRRLGLQLARPASELFGMGGPPSSDAAVGAAAGRDPRSLAMRLALITRGKVHCSVFEDWVRDVLEVLFCPPLTLPIPQKNTRGRVHRRDFILPNYAPDGIWEWLFRVYRAHFVTVEVKNGVRIGKSDVQQVAGYLSLHGLGMFALIFGRTGTVDESARELVRQEWQVNRKMIVVLNDEDYLEMLQLANPETLIRRKIEEFRIHLN